MKAPEICPNCNAPVPRGAKCCPECGSDEKTGWSDSAYASNLGIPDDNFDYEQFVQDEFEQSPKPRSIHWIWWITAILMVLLFLFFWLR